MRRHPRLQRKLTAVLELCDQHLFQGVVIIPVENTEPVAASSHLCRFCRHRLESGATEMNCRHSILSGAYQAFQTGEPFFTVCWLGLSTFVIPIAPGGVLHGALSIGGYRFVGEPDISEHVSRSLSPRTAQGDVKRQLAAVPGISAFQARQAAAFVWDALLSAGINSAAEFERRHEHYLLQRRIAEQMHRYCRNQTMPDDAAELLPLISAGLRRRDRDHVMVLFNDFCCRVLLADASDLDRVKAQFHLLAGLLTRETTALGLTSFEQAAMAERRLVRSMVGARDIEDACHLMFRQIESFFEHRDNPRNDTLSQRVMSWLQTHWDRPVTLAQAARELGASTSAIVKALRRETGRTFLQHLHACRLEEAREMLAMTDLPIYQIADQCGYYDPSHLNRFFTREFGLTPGEFRRLMQTS